MAYHQLCPLSVFTNGTTANVFFALLPLTNMFLLVVPHVGTTIKDFVHDMNQASAVPALCVHQLVPLLMPCLLVVDAPAVPHVGTTTQA